jgi:hypothetical protein
VRRRAGARIGKNYRDVLPLLTRCFLRSSVDRPVGPDQMRDHPDLRKAPSTISISRCDHRHSEGSTASTEILLGHGNRPVGDLRQDRKPTQARALRVPRVRDTWGPSRPVMANQNRCSRVISRPDQVVPKLTMHRMQHQPTERPEGVNHRGVGGSL